MKSLLSLLKDWVNKQPEEEVVEESVESIVEDTPKDTDDYLVEYILSQFPPYYNGTPWGFSSQIIKADLAEDRFTSVFVVTYSDGWAREAVLEHDMDFNIHSIVIAEPASAELH